MKTNMIHAAVLAAISTCAAGEARASGTEGHGGLAVVCRDPRTRAIDLERLEVLDIFEGRVLQGLQIPRNTAPADTQLQRVVERLSFDPILPPAFRREISLIRRNMSMTGANVGLELLPDVSSLPKDRLGTNCEYEQLAVYRGTGSGYVKFSEPLYNSLSDQGVAAILAHEALFSLNRTSEGVERSADAREMTAMLLAERFDLARFKELANRKLPTFERLRSEANGVIQLTVQTPITVEFRCFGYYPTYGYSAWSPHFQAGVGTSCSGTERFVINARGQELENLSLTLQMGVNAGADRIRFYQDGQRLKDSAGRDSFTAPGGNGRFLFVSQPRAASPR